MRVGLVVVGVAGDVKPVPRPALAVRWRRKYPVHDASECLRRVVVEEIFGFFRRRWQAGQIKRRAAQERPFVGLFGVRYAAGLELGEDEPIDQGAGPGRILDLRRRRRSNRLERPETPLLVADGKARPGWNC